MTAKATPTRKLAPDTPPKLKRSFIEVQFPVAKISAESYKERVARQSQTLTGLGNWRGRKPLVLVRAALLGLLMPASDDPQMDRDVFLELMTMDPEGLRRRKIKKIPADRIAKALPNLPRSQRERFVAPSSKLDAPTLRSDLDGDDAEELQRLSFDRLPYSEKLRYCQRPEQIDGPSGSAWESINEHLGTHAQDLGELVEELGERRFGHRPRVGDAFCGGGSIPFEAARLGCEAYGSDLNPVAAFLTWASLNIVGGGSGIISEVEAAQEKIYREVDRQVTEWGIEHNSQGWRADAYLYCVEVKDPESEWWVPLAPSWVIGYGTNTIAKLSPNGKDKNYRIEILEGIPHEALESAKRGTVDNSRLVPPGGGPSTPIEAIRKHLRMWESDDLIPRQDDVFQERLYCIRWVETYLDEKGKERTRRHYRAPTTDDLRSEETVLDLLRERFHDWQAMGYIPSAEIEPGAETSRLQRERGWTHWHHLYTPRQLLVNGLFNQMIGVANVSHEIAAACLLGVGRLADWNSKLCRWNSNSANEKTEQTLYNQALNTLYNHGSRAVRSLDSTWFSRISVAPVTGPYRVLPVDAREVTATNDIWMTDPPYADAISYEEITSLMLTWYKGWFSRFLDGWYVDTKRALAVKGNDVHFRRSMVECYRRLNENMPDDGMQVVMFTHQDASVWAGLSMILWAAGLRVTAAWTIATETDSALKTGNYVQGTVLLVLRKQTETEPRFLDEVNHEVELEVKRQLDTMILIDDESDPSFGDADYQLAAYAAALRVLTERPIHELNPEKEVLREREPGEVGQVEQVIRNAVKTACDHLVPTGIEQDHWRRLDGTERLYLKGLEVESHGEYRNGVYQELARGFGAVDYTDLLASTRANETRLKTASEFGKKGLSGSGFASTLLRQALFAVYQCRKEDSSSHGLTWLRTELPDYWGTRERLINILEYLGSVGRVRGMEHWREDSAAASLLAGVIRNDHV